MATKKKPTSKKPEGLEHIWCKEVDSAFKKLNVKQKKFLIVWLKEQNGAEAYRQAYNKLASDDVASTSAYQIFTSIHLSKILKYFNKAQDYELMLCKKAYTDALKAYKPVFKDGEMVEDIEDHSIRISAAEKLTKLNGQIVDKLEHSSDPDKPLVTIIERVIIDEVKD